LEENDVGTASRSFEVVRKELERGGGHITLI